MEATQAFHRCMQQLLSQQAGCLNVTTRNATTRIRTRHRRPVAIQEPRYRHISTSFPRFQSAPPDAQPNQQSRGSGNNTNTPSAKHSQAPQSKNETSSRPPPIQPERQDNGPGAMDLSSIATSPGYKPPPARPQTTQEARDRATAQLDKLLGLRSRGESRDTNPEQTQKQQQKPIYNNNDLFGPKSSIFQSRRGTPSSGNTPNQSSRGLPDISAMLEDLTLGGPNRPPRDSPINLRLKPTLGRQVEVDPGRNVNVTRAFQLLEFKVNRNGNSVKADERNQKFHVRRGQQRKIDKRRRWRLLFQQGFLAECARIRKMIKQGW